MYKIKKIHSCYQCDKFIRIADTPILKDLGLNLEGACYGHNDVHRLIIPVAKPIERVGVKFPEFCGLDDADAS